MKIIQHAGRTTLIALLSSLATWTAAAQSATPSPTPTPEMSTGEIRKVDKDTRKLTIKHGEIKHLDMPPMTMVFQVKSPTMLDQIKAGDKVRFRVEQGDTGYVVTAIEPASK